MVAGIASLALAAFSLTLPHTPPNRRTRRRSVRLARGDASCSRVPFVGVLFLVTFIDAFIHNGYFILGRRLPDQAR